MVAQAVAVLSSFSVAFVVQADFDYQCIARTGDPYPTGGNYYSVNTRVAYENGTVYFTGRPSSSSRYSILGQPLGGAGQILVDNTMAVPGGTGTFYTLNTYAPSVLNGAMAFYNQSSGSGTQRGIYLRAPNGELSCVVDRSYPMPNSSSTFGGIGRPGLTSDGVYFRATSLSGDQDGFFHAVNNQYTTIVDTSTVLPGTSSTLSAFGDFDVENGRFAFYGGDEGSYRAIVSTTDMGATLEKHVDTLTEMPGYETWLFDSLGDPLIDQGNVAFRGQSARDGNNFRMEGIYGAVDGQLIKFVDKNTPNPGGGGFAEISGLRGYENGIVLFSAEHDRTSTGDEGGVYYVLPDGSVHLLIEETQTLDGRVIEDMRSSALFGNTVILNVGFTDGVIGLYAVTIPEPSSVTLLTLAAATALLRRRR